MPNFNFLGGKITTMKNLKASLCLVWEDPGVNEDKNIQLLLLQSATLRFQLCCVNRWNCLFSVIFRRTVW